MSLMSLLAETKQTFYQTSYIHFQGAVGFIGLVFWSGLNVLTLKTILLWILISFGFLTLIFHAFGSSLLGLVQKAFGAESEDKTKKEFSKEEIRRRKERSRMKKQAAFNDKNEQYRENVMLPKQEAELIKRKKEAQKFHPHWKGEGHRLGSTPAPNICSCGQAHDDVDTDEMDPDCLLDYVEDTQSSSDEQGDIDINMTQESLKSNEQHKNSNTVRQRKKDKSSEQQTANYIGNKEQTFNLLYEEPALGAPGTVTVAFRCPNGETKKRRFNIESHTQCLVDFAESLGYSPTNYCIMTTYPRKPLSDTTKTLTDAGLMHDVVLVIDDLDE